MLKYLNENDIFSFHKIELQEKMIRKFSGKRKKSERKILKNL